MSTKRQGTVSASSHTRVKNQPLKGGRKEEEDNEEREETVWSQGLTAQPVYPSQQALGSGGDLISIQVRNL